MAKDRSKAAGPCARVFIVDDHPLVRFGLSELISGEPDLEVCGEAGDAIEALRLVEATNPDLVVVDISLNGRNGIELIKQIKAHRAEIKMLVSSMHDESLFAERALRAGALGYINKQEATEKVLEAIREVLRGQIYVSPQITDRLLRRVMAGDQVAARSPIERLSDRELQVFELIGQGYTTRRIAARLQRSVKTIETFRENIKAKLNLANSAELTRHATQWVLESS